MKTDLYLEGGSINNRIVAFMELEIEKLEHTQYEFYLIDGIVQFKNSAGLRNVSICCNRPP